MTKRKSENEESTGTSKRGRPSVVSSKVMKEVKITPEDDLVEQRQQKSGRVLKFVIDAQDFTTSLNTMVPFLPRVNLAVRSKEKKSPKDEVEWGLDIVGMEISGCIIPFVKIPTERLMHFFYNGHEPWEIGLNIKEIHEMLKKIVTREGGELTFMYCESDSLVRISVNSKMFKDEMLFQSIDTETDDILVMPHEVHYKALVTCPTRILRDSLKSGATFKQFRLTIRQNEEFSLNFSESKTGFVKSYKRIQKVENDEKGNTEITVSSGDKTSSSALNILKPRLNKDNRVLIEKHSSETIESEPLYSEHFAYVVNAFESNTDIHVAFGGTFQTSEGGEQGLHEERFPFVRISATCGIIDLKFYFAEIASSDGKTQIE